MTVTDSYRAGLLAALRLGSVPVPGLFLRTYARLGITEIEAMLVIHLMQFSGQEGTSFPTPEQLASRMSTSPDRVLAAIERLVRERFLTIEDDVDAVTGVRGERYDLTPLYERLAGALAAEEGIAEAASGAAEALDEAASDMSPFARGASAPGSSASGNGRSGSAQAQGKAAAPRETAASRRKDLFTVFESEFARPLSPMEYETIVNWLDQDKYSDSLIMTALKEAVFAGKVHFRYIDRILMEWQRNRITTPEEAKAYTERFRGER